MNKQCTHCASIFSTSIPSRKFCSTTCYHLNKIKKPKARVKLHCELCNSEFEVEPHRVGRAKYCGLTCKQKAASAVANRIQIEAKRGTGKAYIKFYGRHMHRVVMEQILGRPLLPTEVVHHKDRNKKNNTPGNLEIVNQSDHAREHHAEMLAARKIKAGY